MKNILIAIVIFTVFLGVLVSVDYLDKKGNEAMFLYSKCVERETGMTAMQFYQENGYRLDCK